MSPTTFYPLKYNYSNTSSFTFWMVIPLEAWSWFDPSLHPLRCLTRSTQQFLLNKKAHPVLGLGRAVQLYNQQDSAARSISPVSPARRQHGASVWYTHNAASHACAINGAQEIHTLSSLHTLFTQQRWGVANRCGLWKAVGCCRWSSQGRHSSCLQWF